MPQAPAARFEIAYTACLDAAGVPLGDLPAFARDRAHVVGLLAAMMRTRAFDDRAVTLQRTGRLGTFASSLGQEAVGVGIAAAMRETDVLVPSFREQAAQLWRGVRMEELLLYWGGDERGSDFAGPREDFPICVPVSTQFAHAAGVALAMALRGEDRAVVAVGGDGATSRGDFHEALNIAGVWRLPLVFVINNNQWAISVPRARQTAAETLAQKAIAAGLPGEQVDGCDVLAVEAAVARALWSARAGNGARVIECVSYRLSDHTTADDAARYRDDEEVSRAWKTEPLARFRAWLAEAHGWSRDEEDALRARIRAEVDAAAEAYLATPPQPDESIAAYLHGDPPAGIAALRDRLAGGADA